MNDCPLRVRVLLRVQQYNLSVIHTPGNQLAVADALFHAPDNEAAPHETVQIRELDVVEAFVKMVLKTMLLSDNRL